MRRLVWLEMSWMSTQGNGWERSFFIDFCSVGNPLWKLQVSGLGAGVDSYYEILLKSFIMFGEPQVISTKEVKEFR